MEVNPNTALKRVRHYYSHTKNSCAYLSARNYTPTDLKIISSRIYRINGNLIVQTPVIKLLADSLSTVDSLKTEPVRTYAFTFMNPLYEIRKILFLESKPEKNYFEANRNKIFYDDFVGDDNYYDELNRFLGKVEKTGLIKNLKKKATRSLSDTNWIDEVVVTPKDSITFPDFPENTPETEDWPYDYNDTTEIDSTDTEPITGDGTPTYPSNLNGPQYENNQRGLGKARSAARIATQNAHSHYSKSTCGHCARYARRALQKAGFKLRSYPEGNENGHIDIWNGQNWVSDYIEKHAYVNDKYEKTNYKIYRPTN